MIKNWELLGWGLIAFGLSVSLFYLSISPLSEIACRILLVSSAIVLATFSLFMIKASTEELPPTPEELDKLYRKELEELMEMLNSKRPRES